MDALMVRGCATIPRFRRDANLAGLFQIAGAFWQETLGTNYLVVTVSRSIYK